MTALSLYQLTGKWQALAHTLADMDLDAQTIADTLEASEEQMELEEKVQGYEMVARNIEANVPAIEAEIKRLQGLKKSVQARSEALRNRVKDSMQHLGIQKISCPLFEVRLQKNPASLDVYEEALIPDEFWRVRTEKVLDTAALKDALKAGRDIQGARLTQTEGLRIK